MGGLSSFGNVINLGQSLAKTQRNYKQATQNYQLAERTLAQESADARARIDLDAIDAARTRRQSTQRAIARQKAQYGAQGLDSADGSGEAVILGLLADNADAKKYRDSVDALKRQNLENTTAARRQRNLLNLQQSRSNANSALANSFIDTIF